MTDESGPVPLRRQLEALVPVATYRPLLSVVVVCFSVVAAALEGIGIGFILPIVEVSQSSGEPSGTVAAFAAVYDALGVPFELATIVAGVVLVIGVRYLAEFLAGWLTAVLRMTYIRLLRTRAFERALDARLAYYDATGSDEVLNALITQTTHASEAIHRLFLFLRNGLVSLAYLAVALYVAPYLMLATCVVLGAFMFGVRYVFESGYSVGDRVADANERLQETIQEGIQGIREVKLLGTRDQQLSAYRDAVDQYTESMITRRRNQVAINSLNYFVTAAFVFLLLYAGLELLELTLGGLGVFLFAMFRLGPRLSHMNTLLYEMETDLPHLVRTQDFAADLSANHESDDGSRIPSAVDEVEFDDVAFSYDGSDERVFDGVSFAVGRGDLVAFAGPSGAGKSTVISLLARMYEPTDGMIRADGTPISEFDLQAWRDRLAVVRQDPYLFDDTLRANVAVGNPDASQSDVERACEVAQVTEFLNDLDEGYDTRIGDEGVRLSGGQRQRVAIARALVQDADLLLLDEATSDLDGTIERAVYDGLDGLDRDVGVVTVTHRLSTVGDATRIHILEDGRIVESGTHDELLGEEGAYAQLLESQRIRRSN